MEGLFALTLHSSPKKIIVCLILRSSLPVRLTCELRSVLATAHTSNLMITTVVSGLDLQENAKPDRRVILCSKDVEMALSDLM